MSSVQVNLAAELIDLLPDRQEGWISHSVVSLHMQLGLERRRNVWTPCRRVNVSFCRSVLSKVGLEKNPDSFCLAFQNEIHYR